MRDGKVKLETRNLRKTGRVQDHKIPVSNFQFQVSESEALGDFEIEVG